MEFWEGSPDSGRTVVSEEAEFGSKWKVLLVGTLRWARREMAGAEAKQRQEHVDYPEETGRLDMVSNREPLALIEEE